MAYCCFKKLFQIRTLGMLRSRFESLPGAFNDRLVPLERNEPKKKGLRATFSRNFNEVHILYLYNFGILDLSICYD